MSLEPHQFVIGSIALTLVLAGVVLWVRMLVLPQERAAIFETNRLPHWSFTGPEVGMALATIFLFAIVGSVVMFRLLPPEGTADREGLMVVLNGIGLHGFALLGWPIFLSLRRNARSDFGTKPTTPEPLTVRRGSWLQVLKSAVITLAMALPVVASTSILWAFALQQFGIEPEPQDLLGIFQRVQSPWVTFGMFFVACFVAPANEELIFRGVLFRYFRQRFGRFPALLIPGVLFGALHGNIAGFVPLSLLGMGLAIAYEQTGDLRVPIVAHALFNLNSIALLLSGLATP